MMNTSHYWLPSSAVQVLYHNCPGQRTLLITHSNQALNDLFAKMVARDIPARYLLRLGMGERDLDVDDDFSRAGRVNNMLARRLSLLAEVSAARWLVLLCTRPCMRHAQAYWQRCVRQVLPMLLCTRPCVRHAQAPAPLGALQVVKSWKSLGHRCVLSASRGCSACQEARSTVLLCSAAMSQLPPCQDQGLRAGDPAPLAVVKKVLESIEFWLCIQTLKTLTKRLGNNITSVVEARGLVPGTGLGPVEE